MRRRDMLIGALGLGGATALSFGAPAHLATLALAGDHPDLKDRYFIFCYFSGAWDILLGLDARDPAKFRADNRMETLIHPGYDLLEDDTMVPVHKDAETLWGPFMGDLNKHQDKVAIVRGMSMETLTHEVGRRRFLTAKPPSGLRARGSSTATWLASLLGRDEPIPNLVGAVESYNEDLASWASGLRVASVEDLVTALRPGDSPLSASERDRVQALLQTYESCDHTLRSPTLRSAHVLQQGAQDLVSQGLDSLFDFSARTPQMEELRDKYGIAANNLSSQAALAAMATTAITAGISRCVSVTVTSGLDTHFDNWSTDQGPLQQRGFDAIATIIEDLASKPFKGTGDSWLDHTTIVGFSEFSRTSLITARGGRDHSLTNACLLAGAGIKPGVYGASSDVGMEPQPMNLATGQVDLGGEIVKPEHIMQTLFESTGLTNDVADLRVPALQAMMKS
ncbi:MAG: DUF1501 domain-containing protein [Myxococcota bacterium]